MSEFEITCDKCGSSTYTTTRSGGRCNVCRGPRGSNHNRCDDDDWDICRNCVSKRQSQAAAITERNTLIRCARCQGATCLSNRDGGACNICRGPRGRDFQRCHGCDWDICDNCATERVKALRKQAQQRAAYQKDLSQTSPVGEEGEGELVIRCLKCGTPTITAHNAGGNCDTCHGPRNNDYEHCPRSCNWDMCRRCVQCKEAVASRRGVDEGVLERVGCCAKCGNGTAMTTSKVKGFCNVCKQGRGVDFQRCVNCDWDMCALCFNQKLAAQTASNANNANRNIDADDDNDETASVASEPASTAPVTKRRREVNEATRKVLDGGIRQVVEFLEGIGMAQYSDQLIAAGCDTLDMLDTLNESVLTEMGVKRLHQTRLLKEIRERGAAAEGNGSANGSANAAGSKGGRSRDRKMVPTLARQPGKNFCSVVPPASDQVEDVLQCLRGYATVRQLDVMVVDEFEERIQALKETSSDSTTAFTRALAWLYTMESWVFKDTNRALREDSKVCLTALAPYVKATIRMWKGRGTEATYAGRLYRRNQLQPQQLGEYESIGERFLWPAFTSTTRTFTTDDYFGRVLFVIEIPNHLRQFAIDVTPESVFPDEDEVLLCPNVAFECRGVRRAPVEAGGFPEYPNVDAIVTIVAQYACVTL